MSVSRIDQLRELILKPDKDRLESLGERIESMDKRTADIAEVLPDSISDSYERDSRLIGALRRPLKQCISESVRDEPDEYAAALFPVMGPAIRRSITETLRTWTAQFSQVIEQSLSPRGLRWRFQAWRAGVPFGQFVIQQTLIYRVEDVYLIHSKSGLLVSHVTQNVAPEMDEDAVSAMFSAIQSFVNDSFARGNRERLTTAELDDLTLWAVHGPNSTIVAVIRGVAPIELRSRLETTIEQIERLDGPALEAYTGDRNSVRDVEPALQSCLLAATRTESDANKRPTAAILVITVVVLLIVGWIGYGIWMNSRAEEVRDALASTPGIVVTGIERDGKTLYLNGLRDRLAADPLQVATMAGWTGEIVDDFRPFLSLDDSLINARAEAALNPPDSVNLDVIDGTLVLTGTASPAWIDQARSNALNIVGVDALNADRLVIDSDALLALLRERLDAPSTVEIQIDGTVAVASGEASRAWLDSVQNVDVPAPIVSVNTTGIEVIEQRAMATLSNEVGNTVISFDQGGTELSEEAVAAVERVAAALATYNRHADELGLEPLLTITGHSDSSGSDVFNSALELSRARSVQQALIARGVPDAWLTARGQLASGLSGVREPVVRLELDPRSATSGPSR